MIKIVLDDEKISLINKIKPIAKRDKFMGQIIDWYFTQKEPIFEEDSLEEAIWINIKKPLETYKSKVVNGSKRTKKSDSEMVSETTSEIVSEMSSDNNNRNSKRNNERIDERNSERANSYSCSYNNTTNNYLDINTTKHNLKTSNNLEFSNSLLEFVQKELGRLLSSSEMELVLTWEDNELTRHAIKQTALNRATSLKYTQSILSAYKAKGLTTLAEVEADEKRFEENKLKKSNGKKLSNKEIVDNAWKELGLPDD